MRALTEVARGGSVLDPKIVEALVAAKEHLAHSPLARLTDREREVLGHMAQGQNNAAIAKSLFLTERAVEKHINSLFHKLGLTEEPDVHRRVMAVLASCATRARPFTSTAPVECRRCRRCRACRSTRLGTLSRTRHREPCTPRFPSTIVRALTPRPRRRCGWRRRRPRSGSSSTPPGTARPGAGGGRTVRRTVGSTTARSSPSPSRTGPPARRRAPARGGRVLDREVRGRRGVRSHQIVLIVGLLRSSRSTLRR